MGATASLSPQNTRHGMSRCRRAPYHLSSNLRLHEIESTSYKHMKVFLMASSVSPPRSPADLSFQIRRAFFDDLIIEMIFSPVVQIGDCLNHDRSATVVSNHRHHVFNVLVALLN